MGLLDFLSKKNKNDNETNNKNSTNVKRNDQLKFSVPWFDVFDPRLMDRGVPVVVRGVISYTIEDMPLFNSLNQNDGDFDSDAFEKKLRGTLTKYIKSVVCNVPSEAQIPLVQLERKIMEVSDIILAKAMPQVERTLGIRVIQLDIIELTIDKQSRGYMELKSLTADLEKENILAKHNADLSNFKLQNELNQNVLKAQSVLNLEGMQQQQVLNMESQMLQLEHQRETLRIQREEMQRASRLQTEQTFMGAHQANLNAVAVNNALDKGFNVFEQQAKQAAQAQMAAPQVNYMIAVNNQQAGPFNWNQLQQLAQQGQLTRQTYVWTQGMQNWEFAGNIQELQPLFVSAAPQMPGMPPMPGM